MAAAMAHNGIPGVSQHSSTGDDFTSGTIQHAAASREVSDNGAHTSYDPRVLTHGSLSQAEAALLIAFLPDKIEEVVAAPQTAAQDGIVTNDGIAVNDEMEEAIAGVVAADSAPTGKAVSEESAEPEQTAGYVGDLHKYVRFAACILIVVHWIMFARDLAMPAFHDSGDAIAALAGARGAVTLVGLIVICLPVAQKTVRKRYYLIMMLLGCAVFVTQHITNFVRAYLSDGGLRFLSPGQFMTVVLVYGMLNSWLGLRPWRVCVVTVFAFVPPLVEPVISAVVRPTSWDYTAAATAPHIFWPRYALEVIIMLYVIGTNMMASVESARAASQERRVRRDLVAQAAKAEALLETAVPPPIARALMSGTPAHALTRSFPSASIAFICLKDFEDMVAALSHHELLRWLDDIYGTFDRLIDLYDESIMKIETVMGSYVVAALPGISADIADHTVMLAQFCTDVLELCSNINGQAVNVQIGINCGKVTAGVIGRTRQFYRLFGDTMNVASRMMSTGTVNKIHASKAVARSLLTVGVELHGIQVAYRGLTTVKGKGELPTFWLQRVNAEAMPQQAAIERGIRLELLAREQQQAMERSGAAALNMLVLPDSSRYRRPKLSLSIPHAISAPTGRNPVSFIANNAEPHATDEHLTVETVLNTGSTRLRSNASSPKRAAGSSPYLAPEPGPSARPIYAATKRRNSHAHFTSSRRPSEPAGSPSQLFGRAGSMPLEQPNPEYALVAAASHASSDASKPKLSLLYPVPTATTKELRQRLREVQTQNRSRVALAGQQKLALAASDFHNNSIAVSERLQHASTQIELSPERQSELNYSAADARSFTADNFHVSPSARGWVASQHAHRTAHLHSSPPYGAREATGRTGRSHDDFMAALELADGIALQGVASARGGDSHSARHPAPFPRKQLKLNLPMDSPSDSDSSNENDHYVLSTQRSRGNGAHKKCTGNLARAYLKRITTGTARYAAANENPSLGLVAEKAAKAEKIWKQGLEKIKQTAAPSPHSHRQVIQGPTGAPWSTELLTSPLSAPVQSISRVPRAAEGSADREQPATRSAAMSIDCGASRASSSPKICRSHSLSSQRVGMTESRTMEGSPASAQTAEDFAQLPNWNLTASRDAGSPSNTDRVSSNKIVTNELGLKPSLQRVKSMMPSYRRSTASLLLGEETRVGTQAPASREGPSQPLDCSFKQLRAHGTETGTMQRGEDLTEALMQKLMGCEHFQSMSPLQRMQMVRQAIEAGSADSYLDMDADRAYESLSTGLRKKSYNNLQTLMAADQAVVTTTQSGFDLNASLKPNPAKERGANRPQVWEFKPRTRRGSAGSSKSKVDEQVNSSFLRRRSQAPLPTEKPAVETKIHPKTSTAARAKALADAGHFFSFASDGPTQQGSPAEPTDVTAAKPPKTGAQASMTERDIHMMQLSHTAPEAASPARSEPVREPVNATSGSTVRGRTTTLNRVPSAWKGELQLSSDDSGEDDEVARHYASNPLRMYFSSRCRRRRRWCGWAQVHPETAPHEGKAGENVIVTVESSEEVTGAQTDVSMSFCQALQTEVQERLRVFHLTFPDPNLEGAMVAVLAQNVTQGTNVMLRIVAVALLVAAIPAFVMGINGVPAVNGLAYGAWRAVAALLFGLWWLLSTSMGGTSSPLKASINSTAFFAVTYACVLLALMLAMHWQLLPEGQPIADPNSDKEAVLWYFIPLLLQFQLSLFLRMPFRITVLVQSCAFVVACVLTLASAPAIAVSQCVYGVLFLLASCVITAVACFFRELADRSFFTSLEAAKAAEADANQMLRNLLPAQVVEPIMQGKEVLSQVHPNCAILFADLAGFTRMASSMDPNRLLVVLNTIYSRFDDMVEKRKLWKAETIGDAYIAVAGLFDEGLPTAAANESGSQNAGYSSHSEHEKTTGSSSSSKPRKSHSVLMSSPEMLANARNRLERLFDLALCMQKELDKFRKEIKLDIHMRIGIHIGDVVTGIVGSHRPRFGVFGLPVLIAEELESMAEPDTLLCSVLAQKAYLASMYAFVPRQLPSDAIERLSVLRDDMSLVPVDPRGMPLSPLISSMVSEHASGEITKTTSAVAAFGFRVTRSGK